jgi:hypothetical protein
MYTRQDNVAAFKLYIPFSASDYLLDAVLAVRMAS